MSHPYNGLRNHKVQHARVSDIAAACGGRMEVGGAVDSPSNKHKAMKRAVLRADGGAVEARADRPSRAWGGRSKKKSSKSATHVNVIVAPHPPSGQPGLGRAPVPGVAAAPPPVAPAAVRPVVPAPPGAMSPVPGPAMPPGVPPPGIRKDGGRIEKKKGGAVFSGTPGKGAFTTKGKPADASVGNHADQASAGIGRGRTPIKKSFPTNKQTVLGNVGRGSVITKATGGPIKSDSKAGTHMGPEFTGGGRGGLARLERAQRAKKKGYGRPTVATKNPTQNPRP